MILRKLHSTLMLILAVGLAVLFSSCEEEAPNPNDTKPFVSIVSPRKSEHLLVNTLVQINASDDQGITRVELYFDHDLDSSRVFKTPPYEWEINLDSLRDSTVHLLYAKAYDVEGNVSRSDFVAFYVSKFLPPQNVTVQYITKDSIELRWEDKTGFEKSFEIRWSADGVNFDEVIQTAKMNKTKATIYSSFSKTRDYYFLVRGIRDSISSPNSKIIKMFYGSGGENLFAGGGFESAGGMSAKKIARWNAEQWQPTGTGVDNSVMAMATYQGDLYVGGKFTADGNSAPYGYIARWNGSSWSQVGEGFNGQVFALTVYHGELYAGGLFVRSGAKELPYIARWNGVEWDTVADGFNAGVYALAVYNDDLYATGEFTRSGNRTISHIARLDDTLWVPLREGIDSKGFCMTVYNDELFVGGTMRKAGLDNVQYIAKWNGSSWSSAGSGFDSFVYALQPFNFELYAGGTFKTSGSNTTEHIARYSGTSWTSVGTGIDPTSSTSYVYTFASYNGGLYAAGNFKKAGGEDTPNIARWNGTIWDEVGGGSSSVIYSLATYTADSWQWLRLP